MSANTIYTIERDNIPVILSLLGKDAADHVEEPGYYTMAAFSEELSPAGVIQFYLGMDDERDYYGKLTRLFVEETERSTGVARMLFQKFTEIMEGRGIKKILADVPEDPAYDPAKSMLMHFGFEFSDERFYRIVRGPIEDFFDASRLRYKRRDQVRPLGSLGNGEFRAVLGEIIRHNPQNGLPADIINHIDSYDMDLSTVFCSDTGTGLFLLRKLPSGAIETMALAGCGDKVNEILYSLLTECGQIARRVCPQGTEFIIICYKQKAYQLVSAICPNMKANVIRTGEMKDS